MNSVLRTAAFLLVLAMPLIPIGTATTAGPGKGERVPPNTTYVVVNKKGEKTREYKAGEERESEVLEVRQRLVPCCRWS